MSETTNDTLSGKQQLSGKTQIILVPDVEVYEMEIGGHDRSLLYEGPLSVDYATAGGSSKKSEEPDIFLTAGPLCLELCPERNCIAAAPGVFMLSSDEGTHFYCVALGTSKEDVDCVTKMHFLFKESCYFQKAPGYDEAANRLGVHPEEEDDPKILWMSSKKISGGIAAVTNGLVWTLSESSKAIGSGISGSADFLVDSGIVRESPYESQVNPGVKQTLEAVADCCQKTRDGILWAIKSVVEGVVNRGLDAGESINKTRDGKPKPQSESARALSKIGAQMLHTWFDVGDAVEDAVGDVCINSAKAAERLIETQHGGKAAASARDAFNATGSVMGTALGYRLYRRPAEGRLASTSQANAAASSAPPPASSSSSTDPETKGPALESKGSKTKGATQQHLNEDSVLIGEESKLSNKSDEWPELGAANGCAPNSAGGKVS